MSSEALNKVNKSLDQVNDYGELLRSAGCVVPNGQAGNEYGNSFKTGLVNAIKKAYSEAGIIGFPSGQFQYNLDPVIKHLYPVQTPMLNENWIGEQGGQEGQDRTYMGIAEINTGDDSGAAGFASDTTDGRGALNKQASFKLTRAINNKLMPEFGVDRVGGQMSGEVKMYAAELISSLATAKKGLEQNLMWSKLGLLGIETGALGTIHAGGSLADGTYTVYVTGLNYWGLQYFKRLQRNGSGTVTALSSTTTGYRYGETSYDSDASATTSSTNNSVVVTWDIQPGAMGYNIYAKKDSGTIYWLGIAYSNKFTINSLPTTFPAYPPTVDKSDSDLKGSVVGYDGMYSQMLVNGTYANIHAYTKRNTTATALTATAAGCGIAEFEDVFQQLWIEAESGPDLCIVNGDDWANRISPLLTSGTAPVYNLMAGVGGTDTIAAGTVVDQIKNQYSGQPVKRLIHPLAPAGKVIFYKKNLPTPNNNVGTNSTHFYNEYARQISLFSTKDLLPPGQWGISTIGQQFLAWPNACGLVENFNTGEHN